MIVKDKTDSIKVEDINRDVRPVELIEDELSCSSGEIDPQTKPRQEWQYTADWMWCPHCKDWRKTNAGPTINGAEYNVCNVCSGLICSSRG